MTKKKHPLSMWIGGLATLAFVASTVAMVGCTAHVGPRRPVVRKKVVVHRRPVVKKKVVIVK